MNYKKYLLALHKAMNLTLPRYTKLKNYFENDWEKAFRASLKEWQQTEIDSKGIEIFFMNREKVEVENLWGKFQKAEAKIVEYDDSDYPQMLKNIPSAPAILFCRGNEKLLNEICFTVVGSRKVSSYGKRAIHKILEPIAQQNLVIVSGLAFGIDALAHQIALERRGKTIAVLGNGIDEIYPKTNIFLASKILENGRGAIISEFPPGTEAIPEFFPRRNRIVAGLGKGTLVIEASLKSGSLITAGFARDYGREVFAVPGEIFSSTSEGCNQLIEEGAHLATNAEKILEILGFHEEEIFRQIQKELPQPSFKEDRILKFFEIHEKIHIDQLIRESEISSTEIISQLAILELKGFIRNIGNSVYIKN